MEKNKESKKWERFLYRMYRYASGQKLGFLSRITPVGYAVIIFMIVAGFLALVDRQDQAMYQVLALSICAVTMSFVLSLFRRVALKANRTLPRFATVGEELRYSISVENISKQTTKDAWLLDLDSERKPSEERFIQTEEPGEKERNAFDRKFIFYRWKWLMNTLVLFDAQTAKESLSLRLGKQQTIPMQLTPLRRGLIELSDLRVILPDPLGLFQQCQEVPCAKSSVLVLPKRYQIGQFEMPGAVTFNLGGEMGASRLGDSGDFVSMRDYRPGDPMRNIHWKSWARTGKPIVKEYEDTHYPRYGLILDTAEHGVSPEVFEQAVSVAASFTSTLDKEECLLDFMFLKGVALRVTVGRGVARPERLLEALAAVEPDPKHNLRSLERLILKHQEDLTGCVMVLCFWSQLRADFIKKLKAQDLSMRVLFVTNSKESIEGILDQHPCVVPFTVLVVGEIQEGLLSC